MLPICGRTITFHGGVVKGQRVHGAEPIDGMDIIHALTEEHQM